MRIARKSAGSILRFGRSRPRPAIQAKRTCPRERVGCVPFLLLAYVVYYGLPEFGLRLDPWWAGLMSLTVYTTAYLAEIFRAGFRAVAPDNIEAAHAFRPVRSLIYGRIILPQVALTAAPVIG
ncbi:ABC transporter permease subunit, partial [Methylobacterium sp. B1]|uniref:ABC transporter permease subunit n=1 Tax=Methylobacterium sp. B1 TaxID=91459 RepID=UPI0011D266D1